ncbi:Hypothetical protein R9X50_00118200 [Acrodontium crateriforme]|uniref:Zn(2)-C6 fungal-type domain-containing protein n=1 Tax=Acrodontium crateriforme TaxID=150365 RepID=A0AAQ3R9U7_9PEZI|nr:Hypothetical protein R9X50_00118200 [Acrodontium crateriforme]
MDTSNGAVPRAASVDNQHIRLACQACQRKKIKCDRVFPCGQCSRSNLRCVPSQRKPRARHAGKHAVDSELKSRIAKLESLVESLSGEVGMPNGSLDGDRAASSPMETTSPAVGKYIGSSFWSSITQEVQGLKDALEDDEDEEELDAYSPETSSNTPQSTASDYDLLLCPPGAVYVMPGALQEPSPQLQSVLYGIFFRNVDPLFRVFHKPSVRAMLEQGALYFGRDASAAPNRLIKAVVWFAAVSTMSEEECMEHCQASKSDIRNQYRRCVDVHLAQADLMLTNDLVVLQAFTLYLLAYRIGDVSRRAWTMTSIVIRIARSIGLHNDAPGKTAYETELRRRLWHQIRFLDVFTALDRGTESIIAYDSYNTPLPKNLNDIDWDENSTSIESVNGGITDMSFAMMGYEATEYTRRLTTADINPHGDTWQQRLEIAKEFGAHVRDKYLKYCNPTIKFHCFIRMVGTSMAASQILRAVRPIVRYISSVPPRIDSPYVLQIAVNSLLESERVHHDPQLAQWRWFFWVHWHAIAVALAGLCSIRDTDLADRAWELVDSAYVRHAKHVADTPNGMLWRPVEKLYRKAAAFRAEGKRAPLSPLNGQKSIPQSAPKIRETVSTPSTMASPNFNTSPVSLYPQTQNLSLADTAMNNGNGTMTIDPSLTSTSTSNDLTAFDFDLMNDPSTLPPLQPGDMSWMDWEHIVNDLSTTNDPINNPLYQSPDFGLNAAPTSAWMSGGPGVW